MVITSQGTNSNGMANKHLEDPAFGFLEVVECENFFEFALENRNKFDAVIDNPPWDR